MADALTPLIEGSDMAGLVRYVDGVCSQRDWDELFVVRDRCEEAVERGKQLWAIAQFAEYRIALEAPGELAGRVIADGKGRFSLGPLWEVGASSHTWTDLRDHIDSPTMRAMIAHERSIRGDHVAEDELDPHVLGVPVALQPWEPTYPVAEYKSDRAAFPDDIFDIEMEWVELPGGDFTPDPDDSVSNVLLDLVKPWWEDSLGKAEVVTGAGTVEEAIRSMGPHRVRMADVSPATAFEAMTWAGASGGSHGRRRGTPTGRAGVWWILLDILGYDEAPDDPSSLGEEAAGLRWVLWDPGDRTSGWRLHVGVHDPLDGIVWVLSAVDAA